MTGSNGKNAKDWVIRSQVAVNVIASLSAMQFNDSTVVGSEKEVAFFQ
jgi:hypothetical protein